MTFWLPEGDGTGGGKLLRPPVVVSRSQLQAAITWASTCLCPRWGLSPVLPILYTCSNHANMGRFFEFTHLYAIFLLFASHLSPGRMFTACERS